MSDSSRTLGRGSAGRRSLLAAGLSLPTVLAAARPAQAATRLATPLSVVDCGAVGDGVTDDTASVRVAVEQAVSEGRALFFPVGTYLVEAPIRIADTDGFVIEMHGRLRRRDDSREDSLLRFVNCSNLRAISLRTDGNVEHNGAVQTDGLWHPVHQAKHDVRLDGCRGVWIGHLDSINPAGDGLYVAGGATPSTNVTVEQVSVHSDVPSGRNAVSVIAGARLHFGAVVADAVGCNTGTVVMPGGFQVEPNPGDAVRDVQVGSLDVTSAGSAGLGLCSAFGRCITGVQIGAVRVHKLAGTHPKSCDINVRGVIGAWVGNLSHSSDPANVNQALSIDDSADVEMHVKIPRLGARPVTIGYYGTVSQLHLSGALADCASHLIQIYNLDDSVVDLRLRDAGVSSAYVNKNAYGTSSRVRFHGDWRRGSRGATCVSGPGVIDSWVLEDIDMTGWSADTRVKQAGANYLHKIRKSRVENLTTGAARPTTDSWCRGDFVTNSTPRLLGVSGSRYVVKGWVCTQSGYGPTAQWAECRAPTGS